MPTLSRRGLISGATALASAAFAKPLMAATPWMTGKPRFIDYPFKLGVASGDPLPTGFVLWTRLAPNPFDAADTGPDPIPVSYEIATDERFRSVVQKGAVVAHPENAHAVHVDVDGLEAGRPYWYRFTAGDEVSPVGRALTAPAVNATVDQFKFAFASCQQYEMGFFKAYRDMVAQNVDLIVHLGDYIYESTWNGPLRRAAVEEARTLADYRAMHSVYKLDKDLQAAHAHCPFVCTWDDHEVVNDYAADQDEHYEDPKTFLIRRAAAYKAYYEHLPLRASARPKGPDMRLYQRLFFGNLIELNMLDTRQYRDDQPCGTPEEGGWQRISDSCRERRDEARSILGRDQERWLLGRYGRAGAKWNILAQGMLFSQHDYTIGDGRTYGSEYWDGYLGSRKRVLDTIERRQISNTVVIGGDVHATYVCDVKRDFSDPNSATLASEFVTTSVTSPNGRHNSNLATLVDNPHIKLYEGRYRGYTLCNVTPNQWTTDMRTVNDVTDPSFEARTDTRWVIEDGVAGAQKA